MFKKLALAAALSGCLVGPAFAAPAAQAPRALNLELAPPAQKGFADVVVGHRPAAAIIATDALYGGLAGAAIGAGVALINGNNYGRDIAIGAGIGLIAGGILGAVDVAGRADTVMTPSEGSNYMDRPSYGVGGKF